MTGKEKCEVLKEIRRKQAEALGIDLHQRVCTYEGECRGTCPKCKAEELQLNAELLRRKALAVGGAIGIALSLTACTNGRIPDDLEGATTVDPNEGNWGGEEENNGNNKLDNPGNDGEADYIEELEGDVAYIIESDPNADDNIAEGEILPDYVEPDSGYELEGDIEIDPGCISEGNDSEHLTEGGLELLPDSERTDEKKCNSDVELDKMFMIDSDN